MNKELIIKLLSAMPDDKLLQAFSMAGGGQGMGGEGGLDALALDPGADPNNKVKGWSQLNFERGDDDRPTLADKNYMIDKLKLRQLPGGMPMDDSSEAYSSPGSF